MDDYASWAHRAVDILAGYVRESREAWQPVTVLPDPEALARELGIDR